MHSIAVRLILLCVLVLPGFSKPELVVYVPREANGALPTAVWLHGYRNFPGALGDTEFFQAVADRLSIAIVGIPGTTTLHDDTLQWSEEPVADDAYIQSTLKSIAERYKLDLSKVALFGFSQGAMVAGDLAMTYPEEYRGALIMSPGGFTNPHFPRNPVAAHREQTYVSVCGGDEQQGNIDWTIAYGKEARSLSAKTELKLYDGMKEHTRPPDFKVKFPLWIAEILGVGKTG